MPTVVISPIPLIQFVNSSGVPLSGALLFTYQGGTTIKTNTYTDATGGVANTNPIVLNTLGTAPQGIFIPPGTAIKFVLAPVGDTDPPSNPIWTVDNITAAQTNFGTMATQNANNVNITGGLVTVGTLSCTGSSTLSTVNITGNTTFQGNISVNGSTSLSGTLSTGSIVASGNITMNGPIATPSELISNAPSGQPARYVFENSGGVRWVIQKNATGETGGNSGSDFTIDAYDDTGVYIESPVAITRSNGLVTIAKALNVVSTGAGAGPSTIAGGLASTGATTCSNGLTVTTNIGLKFTSAVDDHAAGAGTLTNAPGAGGNPTFWLQVSINGSNYAIPCWNA